MPHVPIASISVVDVFPVWTVPTLIFGAGLVVALRAAAWFTRLLEDLGDHWDFSPGLLSFLSALGANIPNYAASLVAFASGHAPVGLGIIVGSNVYNLAVILGLVTFAAPGGRGIALAPLEMRDARRVAWLAAAMGVTTWLSVGLFTSPVPWPMPLLPQAASLVSLLTVGLFVGLLVHALQRVPHSVALRQPPTPTLNPDAISLSTSQLAPSAAPTIVGCVFALTLALAGVIIMVQAGQVVGGEVQLPPAILSLVVLAVATSLPNTEQQRHQPRPRRCPAGAGVGCPHRRTLPPARRPPAPEWPGVGRRGVHARTRDSARRRRRFARPVCPLGPDSYPDVDDVDGSSRISRTYTWCTYLCAFPGAFVLQRRARKPPVFSRGMNGLPPLHARML